MQANAQDHHAQAGDYKETWVTAEIPHTALMHHSRGDDHRIERGNSGSDEATLGVTRQLRRAPTGILRSNRLGSVKAALTREFRSIRGSHFRSMVHARSNIAISPLSHGMPDKLDSSNASVQEKAAASADTPPRQSFAISGGTLRDGAEQ